MAGEFSVSPTTPLRTFTWPAKGILVAAALTVAACASMGPKTIPRDRFDYVNGIAVSWKRQTLLNIVKLRYADTPVFLELSQIVSGYTLQSKISAEAQLSDLRDNVNLGAEGTYTDRPTITYSPLTGEQFVRKLLAPIPPSAVLFLIQSGWPADLVLRTCVQAINGRRNQSGLEPRPSPGDDDFYHLIELLREIQRSGAFGMRLEENGSQKDTTVLFFYHEALDPNAAVMIASLKKLLGLDKKMHRFNVAYGAIPSHEREIAILTRSAIQIMMEIASYIEVPQQHLDRNLAQTTAAIATDIEAEVTPLIKIKSGSTKPADSFVTVKYENHWFWIDTEDYASKRIFTFLNLILMLSETGQGGKLPVLTIPAG